MNPAALRRRADELRAEVATKTLDVEAGKISAAEYKAFVDQLEKQVEEIESEKKAFEQARKYAWGTEVDYDGGAA